MENTYQISDTEAIKQMGLALGRKMAECERLAIQLVALYRENEQLKAELEVCKNICAGTQELGEV